MKQQQPTIFVPELFGQVPTASGGTRQRWDEVKFIEHVALLRDAVTERYTTEIYKSFRDWSDECFWGTGTTFGSYNLACSIDGVKMNIGQITSKGDLYVYFGNLYSKLADTSIADRLARRLRSVAQLDLPARLENKYPPLPRPILKDEARRAEILNAFKSCLDEIRAANAR